MVSRLYLIFQYNWVTNQIRMDLFDTGAAFSCKVPVIATTRPLLKSAVCALAARHLQHVRHVSNNSSASQMSHGKASGFSFLDRQVDWQYQSAKYYHQAIGHLKAATNYEAFETVVSDKEELFAAVAILCTYELMDAPGTAWRAHLSALPLFSPAPDPSSTPCSPVTIPRAEIKRPIFWSLARQDLLCACKLLTTPSQEKKKNSSSIPMLKDLTVISETQTRLDLRDMRFWQKAGLATDEEGFLLPFSPSSSADVEEDRRSNELTWLLGKIANFLTSGDALNPEDYALPRGQRLLIGVTQEQLLERWCLLSSELRKWHDSLPPTFTPSARIKFSDNNNSSSSSSKRNDNATPSRPPSTFDQFSQIWYELPICAATMQSYHMACILLLVNQPQESTAIRSTVSARLKSYRHIQLEVVHHAREICGISLASPPDPVRIHSVQPLFVAGQVFYEAREQRAVLELLAGIERDLGWTTSYHAVRLVDEWSRHPDGDEEGGEARTERVFS